MGKTFRSDRQWNKKRREDKLLKEFHKTLEDMSSKKLQAKDILKIIRRIK